MTTLPETATLSQFAKLSGFKRSYITQLKADDRLVLTDDGKLVRVAESMRRIEDTRDPAKIGVVQRHAAEREAAKANGAGSSNNDPALVDAPDEAVAAPVNTKTDTDGFQYWRERDMRAKALAAERENEIADGKLLHADDVISATKMHYATLRTGLEALPDMLAAQVAGVRDESRARALIADAIEQKLTELARQFGVLAKEAA
jgi:hypothetical protein